MSVARTGPCAAVLCSGLLAIALTAPLGAAAQAPSNPSLNAQLLVGARQGDLAQVERVLAAGAAPASAFVPHRHRQAGVPVTFEPLSRLVSLLASFLDMAGIGMDPNGNH